MIAEATWTVIIVEKILVPVATALGLALAAYATAFVRNLTKKAGLELQEQQRADVEKAIEGAIIHTMQTFTDEARRASKTGGLSKEDALRALNLTKERAIVELKGLGKAANGAAKTLLIDNILLEQKIESLIPIAKKKTVEVKSLTESQVKAMLE